MAADAGALSQMPRTKRSSWAISTLGLVRNRLSCLPEMVRRCKEMRLIFGFNEACHHALSDLGRLAAFSVHALCHVSHHLRHKGDIILGMA